MGVEADKLFKCRGVCSSTEEWKHVYLKETARERWKQSGVAVYIKLRVDTDAHLIVHSYFISI